MKKIEMRENGTRRVYIVNDAPSKTDQSQAASCDVNNIMSKYKKTGQLTHLARNQGVYADVSQIPDLQESLAQVELANAAFASLPSEVRQRFQNSPVQMIEFLQDPSNDEEAIRFGLKEKRGPVDTPAADKPVKGRVSKKDETPKDEEGA